MPIIGKGLTLKHVQSNSSAIIINNIPKKIVFSGGGSGGIGGSSAYSDLYSPPGSGSSWQDRGTAGQDALISGTVTRVNDSCGTGIVTSSTAYISNSINPSSLTSFSVVVIGSFNPAAYWATLWGNENWNASSGYLAYFTSATNLVFAQGGGQSIQGTVSNIGNTNMWSFVCNGGTNLSIYQNSTLIASGTLPSRPPNGPSNTYWGCRHGNAGTGQKDFCAGTYRRLMVYNSVLNQASITANYNALKSPYGLP